jgi:hypothetical protein
VCGLSVKLKGCGRALIGKAYVQVFIAFGCSGKYLTGKYQSGERLKMHLKTLVIRILTSHNVSKTVA